ncbi:MAG: FkbM family methyltransferase [Pseudomonadota bacterium]
MHTESAALARGLEEFEIDCVADVGANAGQFGRKLRDLGYRGAIYSFEPVSAAFKTLQTQSCSDGMWHVFNVALGANAATAQINVSPDTAFSSFLQLSEFGAESWEQARESGKETVQVRTLDSYPELHQYSRILLKSDTQGYDLKVLAGASSLMERVSLVHMELSFRAVYIGGPTFEETVRALADFGFHPVGIYAVSRSADLTLNEADVLFARRWQKTSA